MALGLLGAVAIVFVHVAVHHVHGEPGPLRDQHASKHAKLVLLRLIEAVVQGLGGVGDLLNVRRALRQAVGHGFKMIDRRHALTLRAHSHHLTHGVDARLVGALDRGLERAPKLFLVGCQSKAHFHPGELGVENRPAVGRPLLHAPGARRLLIALRGQRKDGSQ